MGEARGDIMQLVHQAKIGGGSLKKSRPCPRVTCNQINRISTHRPIMPFTPAVHSRRPRLIDRIEAMIPGAFS